MADLYDRVRPPRDREPKRPRLSRPRLALILIPTVLVFVAVILLFIWILGSRPRFYEFVSRLSTSNTYTYRKAGGLYRAEVNGDALLLEAEDAYGLYTYIAVSGPGSQLLFAPEEEPPVTLTYGDGATLSAWDYKGTGNALLLYRAADGYSYLYTNPRITMDSLLLNYLPPSP